MAPQVKLESYKEHLAARIISATLCVKNMRLSVINVYAPTDATESESTKNVFYTALNKTKAELFSIPAPLPVPPQNFIMLMNAIYH